MPKSLILSNGSLLIGFDNRAQVRDVYFPYVGLENHTSGHRVHRLGVWVENQFRWLDDASWQVNIDYSPDSLVSQITAVNAPLALKLAFSDTVYNEKDIFIRSVSVTSLADHPRLVKIFFNQQFEIYESRLKDTAFFDPAHHVIVHYKGRRVFLINATTSGKPFDDYSVGLFNVDNLEGTYKDAEDGRLSKNSTDNGPVDSVIGLSLNLDPNQTQQVYYWVAVSKLMSEAYALNEYVLGKTPGYLLQTTHDFWSAWTNRQHTDFGNLSQDIISLFKKSLLIIHTHADNNGGIIASCDSDLLQYGRDTYSYVWTRDGSLTAIALDKAGDFHTTRHFFRFCRDIISPEGYFFTKYRPDRAQGSQTHSWLDSHGNLQLPIQEDETSLVLIALWHHYQTTQDLEFIESLYNPLISPIAEFLLSYRDPHTHLPQPSYDLWEEKAGVSTFTSASVVAALRYASRFAQILGKTEAASRYQSAGEETQSAIFHHLYNPDRGYFYRMLDDPAVDFSSVYSIFKFGLLPPSDLRLTRALSYSLYCLGLTTMVGGVARYEGDRYHQVDPSLPGNPWFITTMWLAQYYLTQAQKIDDLQSVKRLLHWVTRHALPSGILSEQLHPHTGAQLSAAPLTWSHAEYVTTVLEYLAKLKSFS